MTSDDSRVRRTRRALMGGLVALVVLLLATTFALVRIFQPVGTLADTTDDTGLVWVRSIYGWGKTADKQLSGPQGVAIAPDGTIWATDQSRSRVVGFHPDGTYAGMLYQGERSDPRKADSFQFPTSVAVAPDGTVYVADQAGNRVYAMSADNRILARIEIPTPSSVAVSDDRLVVGSAAGFAILSRDGEVIKVLGTSGTGDDQFQGVRGVAIGKDGTIFAVDQYNNRVSAYTKDGKRLWITKTGRPNNGMTPEKSKSAAAGLSLPAQMALDGNGRLVIADPFNFSIAVLDQKDGKLLRTYGKPGAQDGAFIYPTSVAYDRDHDWFAVADTMNGRVQLVRLPDSGGSVAAPFNRSLTGLARALLVPLVLILLAIAVATLMAWRRRAKRLQLLPETAGGYGDATSEFEQFSETLKGEEVNEQ